ncbi:GNAT family N-acetyltransferase [Streptomyces sp. NPDC014894]|uniref:GNAT family N-acetyltransferase n=1 Tax=unclassified Streptomyces TaxID=2593676 RepID=UPI0036F92BA4
MSTETLEVQVRPGTEADLAALTALYNHYIRETPITFDTTVFTPEQRRPWLRSHPEDGPHRLLVARDVRNAEGRAGAAPWGDLLGYVTSSPLRPKAAYDTSVEISVYCAPEAAGRGVGTLLYESLFTALKGEDVHRVYAGITQPNDASVRLHTRFGFRPLGTYHEVGRKFGRYWDITWYEKRLDDPA